MRDIMLDLETLGKNAQAPIIAVGAVVFDADARFVSANSFYKLVNLDSALQYGKADGSTVAWWMRQSGDARAIFDQPHQRQAHSLPFVLDDFAVWVASACSGGRQDVRLWGNGAAFDNVILRNAYVAADRMAPWEYWNDRCYRTLKNMVDVPMRRTGTHHNALDDARSQAEHLIDILHVMSHQLGHGKNA